MNGLVDGVSGLFIISGLVLPGEESTPINGLGLDDVNLGLVGK